MKKFMILNGYDAGAPSSVSRAAAFFKKSWPEDEPEQCLLLCPDEDTAVKLAGRIPWNRITAVIKAIYDPEPLLALLARETTADRLYLFGDDPDSAGLAARLYGRCGGSSCIGVCAAEQENEQLFFRKRVYSHHMEARFLARKLPCFVSLAKGLPPDTETGYTHPAPNILVLEDENAENLFSGEQQRKQPGDSEAPGGRGQWSRRPGGTCLPAGTGGLYGRRLRREQARRHGRLGAVIFRDRHIGDLRRPRIMHCRRNLGCGRILCRY